jgi:Uma2 family endonuclease
MTTTLQQVAAGANTPRKTYTSEEYFALEAESEHTGIRREFHNGEIIEMTGGTPEHNKVAGALYSTLWLSLRKRPYSLFIADQRLWIPEFEIYTYPDVMVIQNPIQLKEGRKDTVTNPILIGEVLSPSTESYDRGAKFAAYRSIPTVQEYLLIEQSQIHVEHYRRQGNVEWIFRDYDSPDAQILLPFLKVEISLADIYGDIELEQGRDATPSPE